MKKIADASHQRSLLEFKKVTLSVSKSYRPFGHAIQVLSVFVDRESNQFLSKELVVLLNLSNWHRHCTLIAFIRKKTTKSLKRQCQRL